ncbi:unnamed protein product [Peniophora sp. CBMAI 1063]|nr:unnamed protein product [Peniophora sp. CBMAI 1063]
MDVKSPAELTMQYRIHDLERRITQLQNQDAQHKSHIKRLEDDLEATRSESIVIAQAVQLQRQGTGRAARVDRGIGAALVDTQGAEGLQEKLLIKEVELQKTRTAVEVANRQHREERLESEAVRAQLASAATELDIARAERDNAARQLSTIRTDMDGLRTEHSTCGTSQDDLRRKLESASMAYNREIADLKAASAQECAALERVLAEQQTASEHDFIQAQAQTDRLTAELFAKDAELEELRDRITALQRRAVKLEPPAPTQTNAQPPAPHTGSSNKPRREIIDILTDSDDEVGKPVAHNPLRPASAVETLGGVKTEDGAPSTSTPGTASKPRDSRDSLNEHKTIKRAMDDEEVEVDTSASKPSKRFKKSPATSKADAFGLNETTALRATLVPTLNERVSSIAPISFDGLEDEQAFDASSLTGWVRRELITANYKASPQSFHTTLKYLPNEDEKLKRRAIFAGIDQNPGLPQYPGHPGTLIASRKDILLNEPISLFVRAAGLSNPRWKYMGAYEVEVSDQPITPEEWAVLPDSTRDAWAKALSTLQSWEEYLQPLVRMAYRREGTQITDATVAEGVARMKAIKKKGGVIPKDLRLTHDEVLAALDRGDETIDVVMLRPLTIDMLLYKELWDLQTGAISKNPRLPPPGKKSKNMTSAPRRSFGRSVSTSSGLATDTTSAVRRRSTRRSNVQQSYCEPDSDIEENNDDPSSEDTD